MEIFVVFGIVFSLAGSLACLLGKRIEEMMPVCLVLMVLPVFVAGLLDNLRIGVWIVYFLCCCGLIFLVVNALRMDKNGSLKKFRENIFTPGLAIFLGLLVLSFFACRNRLFENIDEFNHWGLIIKNMFMYNSFGTNAESVVVYNDYPPFTACFQYLFLSVQNVYNEGIIIMAQSVLYLLIIMPVTKKLRWNLKGFIKTVLIIIFLPMIFFKNFYLEILVDGILGVMFAFTVFSCYEENDRNAKYLNILSGLIMLSLTKTTGLALAILAILIILVKNIIDRRKEFKPLIVVILMVAIITSLWYIKVQKAQKMWDFKELTVSENNRDEKEIVKLFMNSVIKSQVITEKRLTVVTATMLLVAISLILGGKIADKNYRFYTVAMFICVPIYLAGMLMIYLKIFEPIESMMLACFERYVSTILLAVAAFLYYVSQEKVTENIKQNAIIVLAFVAILPMTNIEEKYIDNWSCIKKAEITRNTYTKIKKYNNAIEKDDKILYIINVEADSTYLKKINEYEIMPNKIARIIIGNFKNIEELEKIAQDYDYLYIYRMKEETKECVKESFENKRIKNDTLYRIQNNEKNINLVEVTNK